MSPLIARPGRNATREAKRIKDIRKVRNAIQWHEMQRKKRQALGRERWEAKNAIIQRIKWENTNVRDHRRKALANVREDWHLGPLRPNRAPTTAPEKYGIMTSERMQKPEYPVRSMKNRNAFRVSKGLAPEYPLIVDGERYFPIVKGDRVAIMSGIDKGKIGFVEEVLVRSHDVIVKGLNMQYVDSDLFSQVPGSNLRSRHKSEVPVPMAHIRLVVPYESIHDGVRKFEDVIVEEVYMERQTTGKDPFTGTDYGDAPIPEHHQYNPNTGLPIFQRYVAGTKNRIEWPWESKATLEKSKIQPFQPETRKSLFQKALGTLRHPINSLKSWTSKSITKTAETGGEDVKSREPKWAKTLASIERAEAKKIRAKLHTSWPKDKPDDNREGTDKNIVIGAPSMSYSLVEPPFPASLGTELRNDIHRHNSDVRSAPDAPPRIKFTRYSAPGLAAREAAIAKQRAAERMKTPMQLRWEMEQVKKAVQNKEKPLVQTEALLAALGKHMRKNGVKLTKKAKKLDEVD